MSEIAFAIEPSLSVAEFKSVLHRSTLAERRPMDEPKTLEAMLKHASVIVTARADGLLIGVSRAISDFAYCTYLSDLAVDVNWQRQGVGRELIRRTHEAAGLDAAGQAAALAGPDRPAAEIIDDVMRQAVDAIAGLGALAGD